MSELTDAIRSKGYWRIDIHPVEYVVDRVPYLSLKAVLDRTVVQLRGWDFPHLDSQGRVSRGSNWLGGETDWSYYREVWRFHQSGQFVYLLAINEDWTDSYVGLASYPRLPAGFKGLGVADVLFRVTETFEFASRLSVTEAGAEEIRIEIGLRNVAGRRLYVDDPRRSPMDNVYSFDEERLESVVVVSRSDLAGRSRELALDATSEFFARFGWQPTRAMLRRQQDELRW